MTISIRSIVATLAMMAVAGLPAHSALAQGEVEISGTFGYSFSEGAKFQQPLVARDGNTYTKINPESGMAYGASLDYFVEYNKAIGFRWSQQVSKLGVDRLIGSSVELTDMSVNHYHGMFTYYVGEPGRGVCPFVFMGLGATQFSADTFMGIKIPRC